MFLEMIFDEYIESKNLKFDDNWQGNYSNGGGENTDLALCIVYKLERRTIELMGTADVTVGREVQSEMIAEGLYSFENVDGSSAH